MMEPVVINMTNVQPLFPCEVANEFGTKTSHHICKTCGAKFSICPSVLGKDGWENCMAPECESYDPSRDVDDFYNDENSGY